MFKKGDLVKRKLEYCNRDEHAIKGQIYIVEKFYDGMPEDAISNLMIWINSKRTAVVAAYRYESAEKTGLAKFIELQESLNV